MSCAPAPYVLDANLTITDCVFRNRFFSDLFLPRRLFADRAGLPLHCIYFIADATCLARWRLLTVRMLLFSRRGETKYARPAEHMAKCARGIAARQPKPIVTVLLTNSYLCAGVVCRNNRALFVITPTALSLLTLRLLLHVPVSTTRGPTIGTLSCYLPAC